MVSDKAAEGAARLNLAHTRIVAPIEGRIGLRNVDVGNQVSASDANGIAVITKMTPIDVEFAVPQDHAAWLQRNGFTRQRSFARMALGNASIASAPQRLFVVAGPEFG